MFKFSKDGVSVVSILDTQKPNNVGEFPIKIRINHQRVREYYSIGVSMSRTDWDKLQTSKSITSREISTNIESSFALLISELNKSQFSQIRSTITGLFVSGV